MAVSKDQPMRPAEAALLEISDMFSDPASYEKSGEIIETDNAADYPLLSLTIHGKSVQDGTPTPDNPVPVQTVTSAAINVYDASDTPVTTTPINLQGHELASLPDGTSDVLTVARMGAIEGVQNVGVVDLGTLNWRYLDSLNGHPSFYVPTASLPNDMYTPSSNAIVAAILNSRYEVLSADQLYMQDRTGIISLNKQKALQVRDYSYTDAAAFKAAVSGVLLYYKLSTPTTYQLTSITPPTPIDGGTVRVVANVTPTIDVSYMASGMHGGILALNNCAADLAALDMRVTALENELGNF